VAGLLQAHLSYRKIAQLLGVTRNTVIGRVIRDDELHAHYSAPQPLPKRERPRWASRRSKHWAHHLEPFGSDEVDEPPASGEPAGHIPRYMTLAELRRDGCRWPVEPAMVVGGHLFCGRPRAGDHTQYCRYHHGLAIAKPRCQ
jgi:hypothetical protein